MFVKTFKTSKAELIILLIGLLCFAATLWYIFSPKTHTRSTSANTVTSVSKFLVSARTPGERVQFLSQFGWEIEDDPLEARDVVIPAEFDEALTQYNKLQKPLGFDLEPYRGAKVKKWVYTVTNYPGIPRNIKATLLILDGKVIGGDISSTGEEKFTHSLLLPADVRSSPAESQPDQKDV
ncbi:MAG: DUF4830 domain-containing protein [Clostridia bacterium]|nr:DUF4830 domain-containing protein [Clostridia bacterium]